MTTTRTRLRPLAALAIIALALAVCAALPAPVGAATASVRVVDSCDQSVAAGQYACFAQRRADLGFTTRRALAAASSTPDGYGPDDLQSAYDLTSVASASSTQRVYVVDAYDDPTAESDLAVYRSQFGLPACTSANGCFRKVNQSGATSPLPDTDTGWAGEIALDLQMVSAICPKCGITLVEADDESDNLFAAVKTATNLGAKFVSMSWGGRENGTETSYDSTYFASSGVVYTAATGDDGYNYGVIYPATSPRVVAVGGTSLTSDSSARGWSETAWSKAGSGCSRTETKPAYQSVVATSTCSRRADSDVSAVADPSTGVAVYDTTGGSGWGVYGGTSASAPIIAATYALAGTPSSGDSAVAVPYAHADGLNDVTSGSTGVCLKTALCTAGSGWDGPTGLGTPNGIGAFAPAATTSKSAPNEVTLTAPGNQTSVAGTGDSLQLHATDSGGASISYTASNLPAGLSIAATTGLISGTPTTAGATSVRVTATDSTGVSASRTFTWTVAAACNGNIVSNSGFESGSSGWRTSKGVVTRSSSRAHRGSRYADVDGYGRTHTDTVARTVKLTAGCHATLRYYLRVSSKDTSKKQHDVLTASVGGTTIARYSNRNRSMRYVAHSIDLTRYAGKTITLTFRGKENSSKTTAFRLDDITLTLTR